MLLEAASLSVMELAPVLLREAIKGLGRKYSVKVDYALSDKVEEEFQKCISLAIEAFLGFISQNIDLDENKQKAFVEYLKLPSVTEQIGNLLDPGLEYFDKGLLAKLGYETMSNSATELTPELIFDAWEEFLKTFSFASRSAPELREFLRASYEAGSFKALSNIEDVLEKMESGIKELKNEELQVSRAIEGYAKELKEYRDWAVSFPVN